MNQNQLTPSTALRTASCLRARRQTLIDSVSGFQLTFRSGAAAATGGMKRLARLPATASAITEPPATSGPCSPATAKISPPNSMPSSI